MDECEFIHIGVVGDNEMFTVPPKAKVHKNERLTKDEGETVEAMYRFCCNPDNSHYIASNTVAPETCNLYAQSIREIVVGL